MNIVGLAVSLPRRSAVATVRVALAAAGLLRAAEQVPVLLMRIEVILDAVEAVIGQVREVTLAANDVAMRVDRVRADAARVVSKVDAVEQQAARLLTAIEPLVAAVSEVDVALIQSSVQVVDGLQPLLRAATLLNPALPDEAAELVHRSLPLVEELGVTALPLLRELQGSIPDLDKNLAVVTRLEPVLTDVETRIAGLPGAGLMRKRGEREIEAAATEG